MLSFSRRQSKSGHIRFFPIYLLGGNHIPSVDAARQNPHIGIGFMALKGLHILFLNRLFIREALPFPEEPPEPEPVFPELPPLPELEPAMALPLHPSRRCRLIHRRKRNRLCRAPPPLLL